MWRNPIIENKRRSIFWIESFKASVGSFTWKTPREGVGRLFNCHECLRGRTGQWELLPGGKFAFRSACDQRRVLRVAGPWEAYNSRGLSWKLLTLDVYKRASWWCSTNRTEALLSFPDRHFPSHAKLCPFGERNRPLAASRRRVVANEITNKITNESPLSSADYSRKMAKNRLQLAECAIRAGSRCYTVDRIIN